MNKNNNNFADDDYYDDEDKPARVENQPYDETVDIADAEEVESVYTPTPRNPKNSAVKPNYSNQSSLRPPETKKTPTALLVNKGVDDKPKNRNIDRTMSENSQSQSDQETPKHSSRSSKNSLTKSLLKSEKLLKRDDYPIRGRESAEEVGSNVNARNIAINRGNDLGNTGGGSARKMNSGGVGGDRRSAGSTGARGGVEMDAGAMNRGSARGDNDTGESDSEEGDDGEESQQEQMNELQGGYDPAAFRDLVVSQEIKEIFKFIERYQPQAIELEFKLKPFIPEYIPCIGDIDAFLKIPRPDGKPETLGFNVLDEPSSRQSDPHVLDLQLRALSKQTTTSKPTVVKSVENANPKAIDSWIKNISDLQKNKPVQIVNYQRAMPDIESLMQQWPPEFEDLMKEISLPSADLNVDLPTYVNILCSLLDIPVYKSKIQSLHVLFSLYSEFKNSGHFNPMDTQNTGTATGGNKNTGAADRLIIE